MEGELRCLEKNKRYPGAKAGAHCKLAPSSKRHRGRSFADQSELNTITSIYHLVDFERILSGIAIRYICWDSYINVVGHRERTAQIMSLALTTIAELNIWNRETARARINQQYEDFIALAPRNDTNRTHATPMRVI